MSTQQHWEGVYGTKAADQVSWYTPHLGRSLAYIDTLGLPKDAAILDVGGGASTFVDDLLDRGFTDVRVLDLSAKAIATSQARLGARADRVRWIVGDVTEVALDPVDFWHDRAVFHFLRDDEARRRYVAQVARTVRRGGHVLVATFGPNGPERCSGLEVTRYDAEALHGVFGASFRKVHTDVELHTTPWGSVQEFTWCGCRVE